jgi:hypothetical protein
MRQRGAVVLRITLLWAVSTVAFGAFVLGTSERVGACSCGSLTDQEAFENADAVFTGTLVEVITPDGDTYSSTDPERFLFEVDEVFKGTVFARQSVVTARDGASCGLEISGSGPFIVFARNESDGITDGAAGGELYSDLCSGTRALAGGELPASFGASASPAPGASAIGDSGSQDSITRTVAVAGVLALFGAGCAFIVYRRRQRGSLPQPAR